MIVNLFDKNITLRDKYCSFFGNEGSEISEPYVNLYVRFKGCNANCLFCEYKEIANNFNFDKYKEVLYELNTKVDLRKIAYTGGEPTMNYNRFKDIFGFTRNQLPKTYISVNTNGINLKRMFDDGIAFDLDNIALSRHHYNDKINDKILGFKSISSDDIKQIQSTHTRYDLMHFSCNLINGYIDTNKKVIKFLEHANDLDVFSAGFVSLLPANDYCKENFVDINILKLKKKFFNSKQFDDEGYCMCRNYLYTPKNFKDQHVKLYLKNNFKNHDINNSMIFDGEYLRYGFGQDNIIY